MSDKRKQRIRDHMQKTGMSYQSSVNQLEQAPTIKPRIIAEQFLYIRCLYCGFRNGRGPKQCIQCEKALP